MSGYRHGISAQALADLVEDEPRTDVA